MTNITILNTFSFKPRHVMSHNSYSATQALPSFNLKISMLAQKPHPSSPWKPGNCELMLVWWRMITSCYIKKKKKDYWADHVKLRDWALLNAHPTRYFRNDTNTRAEVSYLLVEQRMSEVVPHSAHKGAVQDQLQIHLGSPPSPAGPGSMGVWQHNPVDSFWWDVTAFSCQDQGQPVKLRERNVKLGVLSCFQTYSWIHQHTPTTDIWPDVKSPTLV